jgi:hypothetical protein
VALRALLRLAGLRTDFFAAFFFALFLGFLVRT